MTRQVKKNCVKDVSALGEQCYIADERQCSIVSKILRHSLHMIIRCIWIDDSFLHSVACKQRWASRIFYHLCKCIGMQAACCVVSHTENGFFDAYVLSESSLFVYPDRLVIKTCGNTHLLNAAPCILDLAAGLGMSPSRCKYSRASYLFPELQVWLGPQLPFSGFSCSLNCW